MLEPWVDVTHPANGYLRTPPPTGSVSGGGACREHRQLDPRVDVELTPFPATDSLSMALDVLLIPGTRDDNRLPAAESWTTPSP